MTAIGWMLAMYGLFVAGVAGLFGAGVLVAAGWTPPVRRRRFRHRDLRVVSLPVPPPGVRRACDGPTGEFPLVAVRELVEAGRP
jgi:hypothetical protein